MNKVDDAILLCRISDEKQKGGYSLDARACFLTGFFTFMIMFDRSLRKLRRAFLRKKTDWSNVIARRFRSGKIVGLDLFVNSSSRLRILSRILQLRYIGPRVVLISIIDRSLNAF